MNFIIDFYLWIKAVHIISVISWMAGLFYLPRLFVHHVERGMLNDTTHQLLQIMEYKLLKVIMNPAMISTWVFGVLLAITPGVVDWWAIWPWIKFLCICAMTIFHMWLARQRVIIAAGKNTHSGRFYRMMNEVPTFLMICIVVMIVVKPI